MIAVIFSYVKSAVVFVLMTLVAIAGIVATCLFTFDMVNFVVRIVGICVFFIVAYAASCAYAFKLIDAQADKMGNIECNVEALSVRLKKLSKRTFFGGARGAILSQYAYTLMCLGKYKEAEIAMSDAIVAAGDKVKGDAAVLYCKIYFMLGDKQYFDINYSKAMTALNKDDEVKKPSVRMIAYADKVAIEAMKTSLEGDNEGALRRLGDFLLTELPPLIQKNFAALKEYIEQKNTAEI